VAIPWAYSPPPSSFLNMSTLDNEIKQIRLKILHTEIPKAG